MSLADDLQKLQNLREQGARTDEEFVLAKKRLLDGAAEAPSPEIKRPSASASALRQLRRSLRDRWIGGVCGGLAEVTGIPSWAWRILFVLTALLHGLGIVMYILLWIFVPVQTETTQPVVPVRE